MRPVEFQKQLEEKGILLSNDQLAQFDRYFHLLIEWNERMNLTAITEEGEVYLKHFFDSVSPSFFFDFSQIHKMIDIGAGAGFPSIPLKICFPHLDVTIIDSLQKRISFLEQLVAELQLEQVTLIHGRAEDMGQQGTYREQFDMTMARAVAKLPVLAEYCLPFVRKGGHFIVMKGSDVAAELEESKTALNILGGVVKTFEHFLLPEEGSQRNIVMIEKIKKTPSAYPRKAGLPIKKPIQ